MKIVYLFDPITGLYSGIYEAQESPLEPGVFLTPESSTEIAPAEYEPGFLQIYKNGAWFKTPDQTGKVYYGPNGEIETVTDPLYTPPTGWTLTQPIANLKDAKYNEIRDAYNIAADLPVTALNATWNGGFDSAIKLDAAKRLSESAGATGVRFYDIDNVAHDLSFADALTVCIAVAVAYQTALGNKQTKFAAIKAATTKTQVNAIVW